jgi:hypothetical protein
MGWKNIIIIQLFLGGSRNCERNKDIMKDFLFQILMNVQVLPVRMEASVQMEWMVTPVLALMVTLVPTVKQVSIYCTYGNKSDTILYNNIKIGYLTYFSCCSQHFWCCSHLHAQPLLPYFKNVENHWFISG